MADRACLTGVATTYDLDNDVKRDRQCRLIERRPEDSLQRGSTKIIRDGLAIDNDPSIAG
jgi:hypothetical protein